MSTDLQLRNNLPPIRLTALKIEVPAAQTPPESASEESCTVESEELDLEVTECRTPTSSEHKIPEIMTCPPAPKKQRMYVPSCKRRLSEFELFEIAHRDEIESFFNSSYEVFERNSITNNMNKRRYRPV